MICMPNDIFILPADLTILWMDLELWTKVTFFAFLKALIHCILSVVCQRESKMLI